MVSSANASVHSGILGLNLSEWHIFELGEVPQTDRQTVTQTNWVRCRLNENVDRRSNR